VNSKVLFEREIVNVNLLKLMDEYNPLLSAQSVDPTDQGYQALMTSISNSPHYGPHKILEIGLKIEKIPKFTEEFTEDQFKKEISKIIGEPNISEEVKKKYGVFELFVIGGNHRVHIFRHLLKKSTNKKSKMFYQRRPAIVYLNLEDFEIEAVGKMSNQTDEYKINNSEKKVIVWMNKKYKLAKKQHPDLSPSELWKTTVPFKNSTISLYNLCLEMKIRPLKPNINKKEEYLWFRFASFGDELLEYVYKIIDIPPVDADSKKKNEKNKEYTGYKASVSTMNFLINGADEKDKLRVCMQLVEDRNYNRKKAIADLNNSLGHTRMMIFVCSILKIKDTDKFFESSNWNSMKVTYLPLFIKSYLFPNNVVLFKGQKKIEADSAIIALKNEFLNKLNRMLKSKKGNDKKIVNLGSDDKFLETDFSFQTKVSKECHINLFNQPFPFEFENITCHFHFSDIPYNNSKEEGFNLEYNQEIDVKEFALALVEFNKNNIINNCIYVIFCTVDQIEDIKSCWDNNDVEFEIVENILYKFQKKLDFSKLPYKGFIKSHEYFWIVTFGKKVSSCTHEFNHNNLYKLLKSDDLVTELETRLHVEKEQVETILTNHFNRFSVQLSSSTTWMSNSTTKFLIQGNVVNIFEKPQDFLENLLNSFTDSKSSVYEWCMGSGSLMEACFKKNLKYSGWEMNSKQFQACKTRLIILYPQCGAEEQIELPESLEKTLERTKDKITCLVCDLDIEKTKEAEECTDCEPPHWVHPQCLGKCENE
jgi:hypothetical protein